MTILITGRLTLNYLNYVEEKLSKEEVERMNRAMDEALGDIKFGSYTELLIAKDAFKKGYLASFIRYQDT